VTVRALVAHPRLSFAAFSDATSWLKVLSPKSNLFVLKQNEMNKPLNLQLKGYNVIKPSRSMTILLSSFFVLITAVPAIARPTYQMDEFSQQELSFIRILSGALALHFKPETMDYQAVASVSLEEGRRVCKMYADGYSEDYIHGFFDALHVFAIDPVRIPLDLTRVIAPVTLCPQYDR